MRIDQKAAPTARTRSKPAARIFTYNLKTDQIILSGGYPWVTQGATYMRAKEPNLILRIFPKTGSFVTEGNWEWAATSSKRSHPQPKANRRSNANPTSLPMHDPGSTCSNTESAVLFANGLRKTYGGRAVVDGVSITVQPREIVGLLGPNGAGKTTSFYMIAGLVPAGCRLGLLQRP